MTTESVRKAAAIFRSAEDPALMGIYYGAEVNRCAEYGVYIVPPGQQCGNRQSLGGGPPGTAQGGTGNSAQLRGTARLL